MSLTDGARELVKGLTKLVWRYLAGCVFRRGGEDLGQARKAKFAALVTTSSVFRCFSGRGCNLKSRGGFVLTAQCTASARRAVVTFYRLWLRMCVRIVRVGTNADQIF